MRILIADNDPVNRQLLKAQLEKWDYEVVAASDGDQAWEILQQPDAPTLAVLDAQLRGVTTEEICQRIKTPNDSPYVYLVVVAPQDSRDEILNLMQAGADDGVTRPLDPHDLRVRLHSAQRVLGLQEALLASREHLRRSEEQFHSLFEGVPDTVLVHDMSGRILHVNDAGVKQLGWPADTLVGMNIHDLIAPAALTDYLDHLQNTWTEGAGRFDTTFTTRSGARFDAEVHQRSVEIDVGLAVTNVVRDITARRKAGDERERLDARMQHSQKLESLGILAGGIAHDFNNLLVGILGSADLALVDLRPGETKLRKTFQQISRSAKRASDLTNQMLAYSGKGAFVIETIGLNTVIDPMKELLQASVSKNVILAFHERTGLPAIEADLSQIRQVLVNLVINAGDSIRADNGLVNITTKTVTADRAFLASGHLDEHLPEGKYVVLEVSDNGSGMDAATIEKIFDPFFSTKFAGRGMGLAAVLGIVRGHRGTIRVESTPGQGTRFQVLFPASTQAPPLPPEPDTFDDQDWMGKGTILVVDDEQTVRDVVSAVLERFGFDVVTANDGLEGVELLRSRPDDVSAVILDMTMPRMNGDQAFLRMRDIRADVPIILASGFDETEVTGKFVGRDLTAFLKKPFEVDDLMSKVQQALAAPPQPQQRTPVTPSQRPAPNIESALPGSSPRRTFAQPADPAKSFLDNP